MNTRKNTEWRLEEDISNAGVPLRNDQVLPLEENVNDDQTPVNPPPLKDGEIRAAILPMDQAVTTQAQATTTQDQAMTANLIGRFYPE